jgi:hypothetical protein
MKTDNAIGSALKPDAAASKDGIAGTFLPAALGPMLLVAAGFAVLMFLCGLALDWVLLRSHEGLEATIAVSDALGGLIAGVLIFKLLQIGRERRQRVAERLQTISDMNHHIRNALQVISFSMHSATNQKELAEIHEALDRIQWALREILPRVEPSFQPFESSVRMRLSGKSLGEKP